MATEWMPLTRWEPRSWLLANGEVVTEPPLEQTGSGRKIRVVGTKTSFYSSDLDKLLWDSAEAAATEKNTSVMIEVLPPAERAHREEYALGYDPAKTTPAKLHVVHEPNLNGATTALWWRFKSPNVPFEAVLSVEVMNYAMHTSPSRQYLKVRLVLPFINRYNQMDTSANTSVAYSEFVDSVNDAFTYKWREFVRDNRPNWDDSILTSGSYINTHFKAVEQLLQITRHIESLDTLQVPNVADLDNPGWLDLELYDTNVNAEVISDMTEWLDANPLAEGVLNAYQNLLLELNKSGFSVNEKASNDFLSALLTGDSASMGMTVTNALDTNGGVDRWHQVSVHLPSGTFVVECSHSAIDQDTVSERWEEALTIARLSGEENVLLEFARASAAKESRHKAKQVIKDRQ